MTGRANMNLNNLIKRDKKGELSVRTIIIIIIVIATLVALLLILASKGKLMTEIWGKGPF
ncbi:hypothetical protein GF371_00400 [Candidatus Woesearchaeota archaeon]|nr:hypothetical protein [Candidatus Woesearchaeota archaeon]